MLGVGEETEAFIKDTKDPWEVHKHVTNYIRQSVNFDLHLTIKDLKIPTNCGDTDCPAVFH